VGFVDNTNILTYGVSIEANCRNLEKVYEQCLQWARRHGMTFALQKYKLTHFTRARTKFNLQAIARFQGVDKELGGEVRILGV
jgi:hypothetical protein